MTDSVMVMNNHSNNNNDEWFTPPEYVDSARWVMEGIDVDPASNDVAQRHVGATVYYTKENSSLTPEVEWCGKVWMNPPYSRVIKEFVSKLVNQFHLGNVTQAIVVTNNGTDTRWYQELLSISTGICLPRGRIAFMNEHGERISNNNKGQTFFYIGQDFNRFAREFHQYGSILEVR
ncbi:MAG: DNA N-6-adenine-methyltransferase [Cetobacterium sp.]|uniref:DNA N-6-adenine-methyltransferase n=1 Tax=Cetobacterium sp. TaxID=2071632 RepID=UPI003EE75DEE